MYRQHFKDSIYLEVAHSIARLSKDENTNIGSVIVAKDGSPVSWGYNGTVSGFRDYVIPHNREKKDLSYIEGFNYKKFKADKYPFMCHAEENALDFADNDKLEGATVYVTAMPCSNCARQIAKKKISRVVVSPNVRIKDKESSLNKDDNIAKFIFAEAGIELFVGTSKKHIETDDTL